MIVNKIKKFFDKVTGIEDKRIAVAIGAQRLALQKEKNRRLEYAMLKNIVRAGNIDEWDWVENNYPKLLPHILRHIERNGDYNFIEAFETVNSGIYNKWRNS